MPIVVTNLEGLDFQVEGLTADGLFTANEAIELPDAPNVAFRHPLPSREWLKGRSGALFANVLTRPPTVSYENRLFTQVTPFAVHTKFGHQNTAVWVTDMATGLPVEGASVFIYRTEPESALRERAPLSSAITDAAGVALLAGQAELNPLLETQRWNSLTQPSDGQSFFVSVEKEGELALAPLSSDFWVYIEGANNTWIPSYTRTRYGHVRAWGTTAQGVYRLGDTIQYKLYVRDQNNERFVKAPKGSYHLQVLDPMEKVVHEETDVDAERLRRCSTASSASRNREPSAGTASSSNRASTTKPGSLSGSSSPISRRPLSASPRISTVSATSRETRSASRRAPSSTRGVPTPTRTPASR